MDLKHAFRMLLKRPGVTAVAVLTLAVGIGANTAIFSVVNGVLLRPLPYPQPDRVVRIYERSSKYPRNSVSNPNFLDWRQRARSFEAMAEYVAGPDTVLGGSEPVFANVAIVTADFFRVFGVNPAIGRTFVPEEQHVGGVPAVVVSRRFWERTLGGVRDLSQLHVVVEGMSARVVGVMPPSFDFPAQTDLWGPRELQADDSGRTSHGNSVVARLKAGVPLERAASEMNEITAALKQQYGNDDDAGGATTMRLQDALASQSRGALLLLLAAVALVLLIACANVAATMLARGEERRLELAVQAALGASRRRLIRQLLAESLLFGVLGASAGLLLAGWLVRLLQSFNDAALPAYASVSIDWRVLAFALALGVVTPLIFGLVPALQASHPQLRSALAEGGRSSAAPTRASVRNLLVGTEVAVALLLLIGAALLIRSFANVMSVDPGFDPRGVVTAHASVPGNKYQTGEAAARFYAALLDRVRSLPGVSAAGATSQLPLSGNDANGALAFVGTNDPAAVGTNDYAGWKFSAGYRVVTPGYFEALGIRVIQGRAFVDGDRAGQPPAAVVNQAFVRQFLPTTNPIGVRFHFAGMDPVNPVFTIVGVVADVRHRALASPSAPEVSVSMFQAPFRARYDVNVVARAATPAGESAVAAELRSAVRSADPDVPVELSTMEAIETASVGSRRFMLFLTGAFAALALLLAATGIYSVLSQIVAQRTQEVGIRMALGADASRVVGLMLRNVLAPVAGGIVTGIAGAAVAVRLLRTFLFGVQPIDAAAFAGAATVLLSVALLAAYVPARRATRVDPVTALRS